MGEFSRRSFLGWSGIVGAAAFVPPLASLAPLAPAASAAASAGGTGAPLALDALVSDWLPQSALSHLPALSNFWGGVNVDGNVLGITNLTTPPYSQGGSAMDLTVDGVSLATTSSRWSAYELLRKATTAKGLQVQTAMRMGFEANQTLWQITVTNPTSAAINSTFVVGLGAYIRKYTSGWSWTVPRPSGATNYTAQTTGSSPVNVVISDKNSAAVVAIAADSAAIFSASGDTGTATWSLTVAAGATTTLQLAMAYGDTSTGVALVKVADAQAEIDAVNAVSGSFATAFSAVKTAWSNRWTQAFTVGNTHYSGSLPVLATDGSTTGNAIAQLYYMSILSVLCCERTNLGSSFNTLLGRTGSYSGFDRSYVTAAPEYACTVVYFWDTSYCSVILSLLDPSMTKAMTKYWLGQDIHGCYAVDLMQGGTVGPWYSANDLTVSSTILNYLSYSGDMAYLDTMVGGKSVLQLLTDSANHWSSLVPSGGKLADYGSNENLLEVLPQYTNQVASLNAANVWLMDQVATLQDYKGNSSAATTLRSSAASLLPDVMALYQSGKGVWSCRHADGSLVTVRTVVDFAIGGNLLADNLTSQQKTEMKAFVTSELLAGDWMRALSLSDSEAPVNRPDHGTNGSYDTWPALTAQAFARFGDYAGFLSQLATYSGVTSQGPFGQAHQLATLAPMISDRAALNPTAALTVSAWINPSSWPSGIYQGSIIAKDAWASGNGGYVLRGGSGGAISFALVVGGNWTEVKTTATVPTGGWHHVAGTYDGSMVRVYIDGVQQATAALTGAITPSTGTPVGIGICPSDTTRAFAGSIDEPRIYSRALSAAQISAQYQASDEAVGTTDPKLALYVATNNGSVLTYPDAANLDPTAALTLAAWVDASSWPTNIWQGSIIAKDTWADGDKGYVLRGGAGGRISFALVINGTWVDVQTTSTVPTGGWHHVAGTYDGSTVRVYIDGVQRATSAVTGTITPSTGTALDIGASPADASRSFSGTIQSASVLTRALTAGQVATLASSPSKGEPKDLALVLRMPFDEGTGPSATEAISGQAIPLEDTTWTSAKSGFGSAINLAAGAVSGVVAGDVMTFNEVCGGKFADIIISDLFGYAPTGTATALKDPTIPRGLDATLSGVVFNGTSYTVTSSSSGVAIAAS